MSNDPFAGELPLSRLFSQFLRTWNYRPVTSWDHFYNPQFFINSNPGDVAVENDVLREVGSYGLQLGTIIDALRVVVSTLKIDDLLPADRRALDRLNDLADGVNAAVARHRPSRDHGLTMAEVDNFAERLDRLRRHDPAAGQAATERLGQVLGGVATAP
jgi:hypothetical protein